MNINNIARKNIVNLAPYSSARSEFSGEASVFLDANENSLGSVTETTWNRYPDPNQLALKQKLSELKSVAVENIFLGNGSDEAIDILFRVFCEPKQDKAMIFTPTYGMYQVSANINNVDCLQIPLDENFQLPVLDSEQLTGVKLLFICSPNNPTGNLIDKKSIVKLLGSFQGIVVIDEAYIDFSPGGSWISTLTKYPNLVVLQTFSKAWGLAGLRIGVAYANTQIIALMNKVKPPYNINEATQQLALEALYHPRKLEELVCETLLLKEQLQTQLAELQLVEKIYPSDANFMLVKVADATKLYQYLVNAGIVVRNRHGVVDNCLRITVGTREENEILLDAITNY